MSDISDAGRMACISSGPALADALTRVEFCVLRAVMDGKKAAMQSNVCFFRLGARLVAEQWRFG
ncbi:MAG: hypothetical protein GX055_05665 [Desulfovibrionales bacterium]|nr:hypothetical protein [Desulfovibrionales bacterium]